MDFSLPDKAQQVIIDLTNVKEAAPVRAVVVFEFGMQFQSRFVVFSAAAIHFPLLVGNLSGGLPQGFGGMVQTGVDPAVSGTLETVQLVYLTEHDLVHFSEVRFSSLYAHILNDKPMCHLTESPPHARRLSGKLGTNGKNNRQVNSKTVFQFKILQIAVRRERAKRQTRASGLILSFF